MDVFAHAIEAFASTAATSFTDPYAIEALRLVIGNLPIAYADGKNIEARINMHNASCLIDMTFTKAP